MTHAQAMNHDGTGARPAIGYCRVSTEEQSREGVSLAAQEARIRAFCAAQGLLLGDVLVDAGASASTLDRPALRDLLARIEAGTVGTVVVAKLDRLTRRTRDLLALVEDTFRAHHVELVSLSEQLDTRTPAGVLMLTVLGGFAQLEREQVGERTRAALAYKRERGERLGTTPLGFRTPGPGVALEPVEAELGPVRYILRRRGEGATFRTIAAELTAQGLPTKRGGHWHETTVRRLWRGRARYATLPPA
jgi:DNA invertase Pin-like site-specific DNA recombinase